MTNFTSSGRYGVEYLCIFYTCVTVQQAGYAGTYQSSYQVKADAKQLVWAVADGNAVQSLQDSRLNDHSTASTKGTTPAVDAPRLTAAISLLFSTNHCQQALPTNQGFNGPPSAFLFFRRPALHQRYAQS